MRLKIRLLEVMIVSAIGMGSATAQEGQPLARAEIDKRAKAVAYDIVLRGAEIFNDGKHEECVRLYEGCLWTLRPLLDHRTDLQKLIQEQMDTAAKLPAASDKAFALRKALDGVLQLGAEKKPPLWERLGGEEGVSIVIHDFVGRAAANPDVNFFRNGRFKPDAEGVKKLERQLVELVSSATGGPLKYTGRDMKTIHAGMKITAAEFDALAADLLATLKKYKVPEAETDELIRIVSATANDIVEERPKKK